MKTFAELDSQDTITLEDMNCFADGILDQEKKEEFTIKPFYGNFIRVCNLLSCLPIKEGDKWYWHGILRLLDNKGYYSTQYLYMNMYYILYNMYWELRDAMEDGEI
jgi:hypothetical protein